MTPEIRTMWAVEIGAVPFVAYTESSDFYGCGRALFKTKRRAFACRRELREAGFATATIILVDVVIRRARKGTR